MISRDGRSTYVVAQAGRLGSETAAYQQAVSRIAADPLLRGRVLLGGATPAAAQATQGASSDLARSEAIGIPILLAALLVVFGGVIAALLPLLGGIFAVLLALLGMSAVLELRGLSVFALNLVVALGLGLSIDFSLLVISRFREQLGHGDAIREAVARTVNTAGRTVTFSALTVTAALGALLIFPEPAISSMAIAGMLVTMSALGFGLIVLPAALTLLGPRINALPLRRGRIDAITRSRRWARIAAMVTRHPAGSGAAAAAFLVLLAVPLGGIRFTGPVAVGSAATARAADGAAAPAREGG